MLQNVVSGSVPFFLNQTKRHVKEGNVFQVKPLDQVLHLELGYQMLMSATHGV